MSFIDIFICINDWTTKNNNSFLKRVKFYSIIRFINRYVGFYLVKIWVNTTKSSKKYNLCQNNNLREVIVSLTSFPGRVDTLEYSIESILRQNFKPLKVLVYLSLEQFPDGIENLPDRIQNLSFRGVDFIFVKENLRSHKKYFYSFREFRDYPILIIDDDLLYDSHLIERLYNAYEKNPVNVYFNYGYIINYTDKGELKPYRSWSLLSSEKYDGKVFFGSGGGTLFPPNFAAEGLFNVNDIMMTCYNADDIWLNAFCDFRKVAKIFVPGFYIFDIPVKNKITLSNENLLNNKNDLQIKNVKELFVRKYKIDVFKR